MALSSELQKKKAEEGCQHSVAHSLFDLGLAPGDQLGVAAQPGLPRLPCVEQLLPHLLIDLRRRTICSGHGTSLKTNGGGWHGCNGGTGRVAVGNVHLFSAVRMIDFDSDRISCSRSTAAAAAAAGSVAASVLVGASGSEPGGGATGTPSSAAFSAAVRCRMTETRLKSARSL